MTYETLIEHKATTARSYRLTVGLWRKIESDAALVGREPLLVINLDGLRLEVRRAP